jgi:hypothetical protein
MTHDRGKAPAVATLSSYRRLVGAPAPTRCGGNSLLA